MIVSRWVREQSCERIVVAGKGNNIATEFVGLFNSL
jgi:hypothetical protein